jgi:tripartite-type tricarboxylate transporter receptor subunit TctC
MHLAGELLKSMANIDRARAVQRRKPSDYRRARGQVELTFVGAPASMPHIRSGRLKVLAVTSARRSAALPDVPTVAELGYGEYEVGAWYGVLGPARTPAALVGTMSADIAAAVNVSAVRGKLLALGIEPLGSTPVEFTHHLRKEIARWTPLIQKSGIKSD